VLGGEKKSTLLQSVAGSGGKKTSGKRKQTPAGNDKNMGEAGEKADTSIKKKQREASSKKNPIELKMAWGGRGGICKPEILEIPGTRGCGGLEWPPGKYREEKKGTRPRTSGVGKKVSNQ